MGIGFDCCCFGIDWVADRYSGRFYVQGQQRRLIMKDVAKALALPFMVVLGVLYLPGFYAYLLIAEQLRGWESTGFGIANLMFLIGGFVYRPWLGILMIVVWPIAIFQLYSNFFWTP